MLCSKLFWWKFSELFPIAAGVYRKWNMYRVLCPVIMVLDMLGIILSKICEICSQLGKVQWFTRVLWGHNTPTSFFSVLNYWPLHRQQAFQLMYTFALWAIAFYNMNLCSISRSWVSFLSFANSSSRTTVSWVTSRVADSSRSPLCGYVSTLFCWMCRSNFIGYPEVSFSVE